MGRLGPDGWWGYCGVPAPPTIKFRFPSCFNPSPELVPGAQTRQNCSRKRGHTGRHAAYGTAEVLAVWS